MPLPVETLTPNSSREEIQAAISASISQCMSEGGKEQEQCVAIAQEIARKTTGDGGGNVAGRKIRAGLEQA